jgi:hypothetical protein
LAGACEEELGTALKMKATKLKNCRATFPVALLFLLDNEQLFTACIAGDFVRFIRTKKECV